MGVAELQLLSTVAAISGVGEHKTVAGTAETFYNGKE
jgi:hypothetical protein